MKTLPLLIAFILFYFSARSQSFCPPGATWNYTLYSWGMQPLVGIVTDKYVGETVINGKTCKHIVGTFKGFNAAQSPTTTVFNFRNHYAYEDNGVVYATIANSYTDTPFDTVVNFNAKIGDKWLRPRLINFSCIARKPITVVDTGHIFINNVRLKQIVTYYFNSYLLGNATQYVSVFDTIIEKIMSRNHFMFPQYCESNSYDFYLYKTPFLCYQDDNFGFYQKTPNVNCELMATNVGTNNFRNPQIFIFPNPTSKEITLEKSSFESDDFYEIELINMMGQVYERHSRRFIDDRLTLDTEQLPVGIYLIMVKGKDGSLYNEKFIKE
jgi:hypothetical protein